MPACLIAKIRTVEGTWLVQDRPPIEIWGYHGTTLDYARSILQTGFRVGEKGWDWLGNGAYFWQDAPARSLEWARRWHYRGARKPPLAVLQAKIQLADCLDMLDNYYNEDIRAGLAAFQARRDDYPEHLANGKRPNGEECEGCNRLDCAFFNHFIGEFPTPIRCVRAAVAEGDELQHRSPIRYDSHVQVAVRDVRLISETLMIYYEESHEDDH